MPQPKFIILPGFPKGNTVPDNEPTAKGLPNPRSLADATAAGNTNAIINGEGTTIKTDGIHNAPIVSPKTLQELQDGLTQGKNWGDPALEGMPVAKAKEIMDGHFNFGSSIIDALKKQLAKEQANEVAPDPNIKNATQINGSVSAPDNQSNTAPNTPAVQSNDNKKDLFNQLVQQELTKTLQANGTPTPTKASDVVNSFQGGVGKGLGSLTSYLQTSQGQNVLGGIFGMFGNQNMANAYTSGANRQQAQEDLDKQNIEKEKQNHLQYLTSLYNNINNSTKGQETYGDIIEAQRLSGQLSDEEYQKIVSNPNYQNMKDKSFASTTMNKMQLDPKNIEKRAGNAQLLDNHKLANKEKLANYTQPQKMEIAKQYGENSKDTKQTPGAPTTLNHEDKILKDLEAQKKQAEINALNKKNAGQDAKTQQKGKDLGQLSDFVNKLDNISTKVASPSSTPIIGKIQGYGESVRRASTAGGGTADETEFNSYAKNIHMMIPRVVDGLSGRQSAYVTKLMEQNIPYLNDSTEVKQAKIKALRGAISTAKSYQVGSSQQQSLQEGQNIGRFKVVKVH